MSTFDAGDLPMTKAGAEAIGHAYLGEHPDPHAVEVSYLDVEGTRRIVGVDVDQQDEATHDPA